METIATIILAAGKGTRMKSSVPKILHPMAGEPMIFYPITTIKDELNANPLVVVVGKEGEKIKVYFEDTPILFAEQAEPLGTAHAVMCGKELLKNFTGDILIMCADAPLITGVTLRKFIEKCQKNKAVIGVLTTIHPNPYGYGRVIRDEKGFVTKIVEEKDATPEEKKIKEINSGIYLVNSFFLWQGLSEIEANNIQGEYYLTDLLEVARKYKKKIVAWQTEDYEEVMGINTREDFALALKVIRNRINHSHMLNGVTLIDPDTTYIDYRVVIGQDTTVYPNVFFLGRTIIGKGCLVESGAKITDSVIGDNAVIRSHSVITESSIGHNVSIGPFAHIRPQSKIYDQVKVGNFVEIKKTTIHKGAKAAHLTYLGDSIIGEDTNVGAGTITCNYDGYSKHPTIIGDSVFIGSNTEIIAPVKIGKGAWVAAGTTVTKDVPENALAVSRVHQKNIRNWVIKQKKLIAKQKSEKQKKKS